MQKKSTNDNNRRRKEELPGADGDVAWVEGLAYTLLSNGGGWLLAIWAACAIITGC